MSQLFKVLFLVSISIPVFGNINQCKKILSLDDNTNTVISFYNEMISKGVFNLSDLELLAEAVETGRPFQTHF